MFIYAVGFLAATKTLHKINLILDEETFFEVAEAVFVGWFTFEYFIRFIAAPRKLRYVLLGSSHLNISSDSSLLLES